MRYVAEIITMVQGEVKDMEKKSEEATQYTTERASLLTLGLGTLERSKERLSQ